MKTRPDLSEVRHAAAIFKALGHPERLRIVCAIAEHGHCTQTQLVEVLGRAQSTIARHLVPLRSLGLVHAERDGIEVPLTLDNALTQQLLDAVCNAIRPADRRERTFSQLMAAERESA